MRLGKNMKHALAFYGKVGENSESWFTFSEREPATKQAIARLGKLGLLEVDQQYSMARITKKGWNVWKEVRGLE